MASLPPSVPHLWLEYDDILAASSSSSCNPPNALYHPTQVFHYEAQVLSDSGGPLIVFGSEGESKELTNLNGFDGQGNLMSPELVAGAWGVISRGGIVGDGPIDNFQSQNDQGACVVEDLDTSFHKLSNLSLKPPSSSVRRGSRRPHVRKGPSRRTKTKAHHRESRMKDATSNPNEKPFPCERGCRIGFVRNTDRGRHYKTATIHNTEKQWKCDICGIRFNRRDNRDHHLAYQPKSCQRSEAEMETWSQWSPHVFSTS